MVGATMLVGMGLSLWWPLWLLPPRFSDTTVLYLAISQHWLVTLILCALLRPACNGWQTMLKLFMVVWPFSAILLWLLSYSAWSVWLNGIKGSDSWIILFFAILTWLICSALPVFALRRWFRPADEQPLTLRRLVKYIAAGIVIAVIYTFSILPNVVLASGGLFTAPLTCNQPAMAQGQIRYTCREYGAFASQQTYSLEGWQGLPVGQLRSHPANDNIGG